jgi:hypothetical protein
MKIREEEMAMDFAAAVNEEAQGRAPRYQLQL